MQQFCRRGYRWMYPFSRGLKTNNVLPTRDGNEKFSHMLCISDEVQHALATKSPVVALESTIITHGMPYPENLRTALEVEEVIRHGNAVPATVAVLEGRIHVGLDQAKLAHLASHGKEAIKASRRDLGYILSQGLLGGTTVSGTMIAAHLAGISTFVTGGIGGVHRGAETNFDISADLTELGRTPVAVVCAGVKSILDIGLTLEYLETQGVPVLTFGDTKDFPAFFTGQSGYQVPYCTSSPKDVAKIIEYNLKAGLKNGMVIAVPIPEKDGADGQEIESAIQQALEEARAKRISGKDVTPYVLTRINDLSKGKSLSANISLVKNNAKVGAAIALELSNLSRDLSMDGALTAQTRFSVDQGSGQSNNSKQFKAEKEANMRPVVIGGSNFDLLSKASGYDVLGETTNTGKVFQNFGGVGRNIAECLTRLGSNPLLISALGSDTSGKLMLKDIERNKMDTKGILICSEVSTACYSLIVNVAGDLILGVGDMDIHKCVTPGYIAEFEEDIANASVVCFDGNLSVETIDTILQICLKSNVPVWFEPTDVGKAGKPFVSRYWNAISFLSPNRNELRTIHSTVLNRQVSHCSYSEQNEAEVINECATLSLPILERVPHIVVTLGSLGVLLGTTSALEDICYTFRRDANNGDRIVSGARPRFFHYPAAPRDHLPIKVASVSGAGDSFAGAMMFGLLSGKSADLSIKYGLYAAYLALLSHATISSDLSAHHMNDAVLEKWATLYGKEIVL